MMLSWASLYGYIQTRCPFTVEQVNFLVDVEGETVNLSVNGKSLNAVPLKFHEVHPLLIAYLPGLGLAEDAAVLKGTIEIDYKANNAVVNVYLKPNGTKSTRHERRISF